MPPYHTQIYKYERWQATHTHKLCRATKKRRARDELLFMLKVYSFYAQSILPMPSSEEKKLYHHHYRALLKICGFFASFSLQTNINWRVRNKCIVAHQLKSCARNYFFFFYSQAKQILCREWLCGVGWGKNTLDVLTLNRTSTHKFKFIHLAMCGIKSGERIEKSPRVAHLI